MVAEDQRAQFAARAVQMGEDPLQGGIDLAQLVAPGRALWSGQVADPVELREVQEDQRVVGFEPRPEVLEERARPEIPVGVGEPEPLLAGPAQVVEECGPRAEGSLLPGQALLGEGEARQQCPGDRRREGEVRRGRVPAPAFRLLRRAVDRGPVQPFQIQPREGRLLRIVKKHVGDAALLGLQSGQECRTKLEGVCLPEPAGPVVPSERMQKRGVGRIEIVVPQTIDQDEQDSGFGSGHV